MHAFGKGKKKTYGKRRKSVGFLGLIDY